MAGMVSAVAVFPIAIPVHRLIQDAEISLSVRALQTTSSSILRRVQLATAAVTKETLDEFRLEHIHVLNSEGDTLYVEGGGFPDNTYEAVCDPPEYSRVLRDADDELWVAACAETSRYRVIVATRPVFRFGYEVFYQIGSWALLVGLVTALGVSRLLSPITEVSQVLQKLGAGYRGVRMRTTGLAELDELVIRLNETARAMEEREEAILDRMEVVKEISRVVAHEVRNPLQSLGFLGSLMAEEETVEERRVLLDSIRHEIELLNQVVHRMLKDASARGTLRLVRQPDNVSDIVRRVLLLRQIDAKRQKAFLRADTLSSKLVYVDTTLIARLVDNLVLNALQAIDGVGSQVVVSVVEDDAEMVLRVDDDGPGVSEELGYKVFDVNVTGREEGTGIGLALVRGIAEAHGGTIQYTRSAMGGASFVARIPYGEG
jgi:signal transduction histidine kinase